MKSPTETKTNVAADAARSTPTGTMNPSAPKPAALKRWPGAWPFSGGGRPRNGKIARLPWKIRELLNMRLRQGDSGQDLADWLNSEEKVRMVLVPEYGGNSITRQNISEWRKGGYREWLAQQELLSEVGNLTGLAQGMAQQLNPRGDTRATMGDHLATLLETRFMRFIKNWDEVATPEAERTVRLYHLLIRDIGQLRRGDHRAAQQGLLNEPSAEQKLSLINRWVKEDPKIEETVYRGQRVLENSLKDLRLKPEGKDQKPRSKGDQSESVQPSPSESHLIQANQAEDDVEEPKTRKARRRSASTKSTADTTADKTPGQGTTNQSEPVRASRTCRAKAERRRTQSNLVQVSPSQSK
jgi:hypothetical protein